MTSSRMQQPMVAVLLGLESHPDVTVTVPYGKLDEIVALFEGNLGITAENRADPARHAEERARLLSLMIAGLKGAIPDQPWSSTCAIGFIWSAITHPESGEDARTSIASSIARIGKATLTLAAGPDSSLLIEVDDRGALEPAIAGMPG